MNHPLQELNETQKRVYKLLQTNEKLRDDDANLVATMHITELGGLEKAQSITAFEYMRLQVVGKLTKVDSITRARRHVQEHYPLLRGRKYKQRKKYEEDVRTTIQSL